MHPNRHRVYALLVALILPGLLIANAWLHNHNFRQVLDTELQRKAVVASDAFSPLALQNIDKPEQLRGYIATLRKDDPLIREITFYRLSKDGTQLVAVVSSDAQKDLAVLDNPNSSLAWSQDTSVATRDQVGNDSVWSVVSPVKDSNGTKVALLNIKISTADIDELVANSYRQSGLLLLISLLIILGFLANYFHLLDQTRMIGILKQVDAMKSAFIGQMFNAFQLPTIKIKNSLDQLQRGAGKLNQPEQELLGQLASQATEMLSHLRMLNRFNQIESGEFKIVSVPVAVSEILRDLTVNLQPMATVKGIELKEQAGNKVVSISTDRDCLQEVLDDLLSSILLLSKPGLLTLQVGLNEARECQLGIIASGLALTPEIYADLREGRDMMDNDISFTSLGVKVWLARRLVQRLGGRLEITQIVQGGTAFQLYFPAIH